MNPIHLLKTSAALLVMLSAVAHGQPKPQRIDFAASARAGDWLQHTVLGGPSFDAFERMPGNPIYRGAAPFEWPVNGFLYRDPVSRDWFVYVGEYTTGYINKPARCTVLRSGDRGRTWKNLGPVLEPSTTMFEKGGLLADVSIVHEAGRYHMIYDWGEPDFTKEGGIAYAWADHPAGPWHRARQPVTRNSELPLIEGRYRRTYAATLVRRQRDWLITGMMDDAPNSWTLFVMTAPSPEGPYTERKLVRNVRDTYFHPPLLEFYPSFVHAGYLYAPATSVARNRNVQTLFRAPLERATEPAAWEVVQHGSLWHSLPRESEHEGIWGQTFSGQVDDQDTLWAMFPSRDPHNRGTIHVARRPWRQPFRPQGFVLTGHGGPSLTLLRRAYAAFDVETSLSLRGTARLVWGYHGLLGPDMPSADASLGRGANRSYQALELSEREWRLLAYDQKGNPTVVASGQLPAGADRQVRLQREAGGSALLSFGGALAWRGQLPAGQENGGAAPLGWWVGPRSHLAVKAFAVEGADAPARLLFDATDALLGAGEDHQDWEAQENSFRSAPGYASTRPDAMAKWNVPGSRFTLWSPRGPSFGQAEVYVDGVLSTTVDLHQDRPVPSAPVWTSKALPPGNHAVVLKVHQGKLAVDCLEARQ